MKIKILAILAVVCLAFLFACNRGDVKDVKLTNRMDSASYAVGASIGNNISQQHLDSAFNHDAILKGLNDGLKHKEFKINQKEWDMLLQMYIRKYQEAQSEKQYSAYKKKNEDFLAENKKKADVKTLPSGVQYTIIKEGTGEVPKLTDKVSVHYVGTTIEGTEFDNSVKRGKPETFPVAGVIKGWTEMLQQMKVGSKYKVFIPQELAYGANPNPQSGIKPYSTLIFEMELISIEPPAEAAK